VTRSTRSTLTNRPDRPPAYDATLTDEQLAVLRGMLEQQRAFRVDQLAQLHRPGTPGPLGSANQEVVASLTAGARAALHDVQKALWRLDEGTYGACTRCGEPLGLERLEILPQAGLCMPCQRNADDDTEPARPGRVGGRDRSRSSS
jgi:DnaK suppressor protein